MIENCSRYPADHETNVYEMRASCFPPMCVWKDLGGLPLLLKRNPAHREKRGARRGRCLTNGGIPSDPHQSPPGAS